MVSVLIITWKRTALLQKCLDSLVPWAKETELQVYVVLNGPDESSAQVLDRMKDQYSWLNWQEIPASSPGKARNTGIPELKGDWVFFLDDDAQVTPDYWKKWQKALSQLKNADVIGGPDAPPVESEGLAHAVGLALSSSLCMGPTATRHRPSHGTPFMGDETVLTSCNLWVRRQHLVRGLRFPETYQRAEETGFLRELEQGEAELWHVPDLFVWHARRQSWRVLTRTSFNSGFFRSLIMQDKTPAPWWIWLPALFVLLHFLPLIFPAVTLPLIYWWTFPVMAQSWLVCQRNRRSTLFPAVLLLHWLLPFSYGVGFLWRRLGGGPWQR